MNHRHILILRLILWSIPTVILGIVLWHIVIPSGRALYTWTADKQSDQLEKISPAERFVKDGSTYVIKQSPLYLTVRSPRPFNKVKLTVKYKNLGDSLIFESGLMAGGKLKNYRLQPLSNELINNLMNDKTWNQIIDGDTILLTKNKKYKDLASFKKNPPAAKNVAVYNYDFFEKIRLATYRSPNKLIVNAEGLLGKWQAYTYLKNEPFRARILATDFNNDLDRDNLRLVIRDSQNKVVYTFDHLDGNDKEGSGEENAQEEFTITSDKLPEGMYKLEWQAGNDWVVDKLSTNSSKVSFVGTLRLAALAKPLTAWIKSPNFTAQTTDPRGLQLISVANDVLNVSEIYKQYSLPVNCQAKACEVGFKQGAVQVSVNGLLSFSADGLVGPEVKKINSWFDVSDADVKYIVAKYQKPTNVDDYKVATTEFSLQDAYKENGRYSIMLSAEGRANEFSQGLEIKEIKVEFIGTSLMDYLKRLFD